MDFEVFLQMKELVNAIINSFPPERKTLCIILILFIAPLMFYSFSCSIITKCAINRLLKDHPEIMENEFSMYPQFLTFTYCFFWMTFPTLWINTLISKIIGLLRRNRK